MVADFCAGAGGKTLAIGALMKNTGRLYAFDISEKRLFNLGKRLKRSGLSNLHAQVISSESDPKLKRLNGKFDRVLVDAPCSGFGTLRRNPDLKWRFEATDVAELNVKQAAILARAAKLTKAGGRLVYATCSLLADENEAIADVFLSAHPEFQLVPAHEVLAQQHININTGDYLKLLPHLHGTDGFFAAVFERKAEAAKSPEKLTKSANESTVDSDELKADALEPSIHAGSGASESKPEKPKKEKVSKAKPKAAAKKVEEA
jgi:16S rRNA (cytosine967-C5)-methyltransferase